MVLNNTGIDPVLCVVCQLVGLIFYGYFIGTDPVNATGNILIFCSFLSVSVSTNQSPQFVDFPSPLWLYENHTVGTC